MPGSYSHLWFVTASIIKHRGSNYNQMNGGEQATKKPLGRGFTF